MSDKKLQQLSKQQLIDLIKSTEERFASSNAYAAELVVELEEKNELLSKAQDQIILNAKLASIGQLAAGVAHEVNNPLAVAVMSLALINRQLEDPDEKTLKHLDKIKRSLKRVEDIVKGLRIYARTDQESQELFDVGELITESVDMVHNIFKSDVHKLQFMAPEDALIVSGNRGRFQQVVMNFLTNAKDAVKATEKKEIIINIAQEQGQIKIEFQDTGEGISDEVKPKIFDMFFTTKPVGSGTGMGLGICSSIIKSMQGEISFTSKLGIGTTFQISLPKADIDIISPLMSECFDEHLGQGELAGKVLIVDDEVDVRENLKQVLDSFGLECIQASDGVEALKLYPQHDFDIVLTDIQMPQMNGSDLVDRIKVINPLQKIVMLTGSVRYAQLDINEISQKVDHLISKPFEVNQLFKILESLLDEINASEDCA